MNTKDIVAQNGTEVSTVVKADHLKKDRWKAIKDKASRQGKMMLFNDYRVSLGGTDAGWGTKVFKKVLFDIELVEPCDKDMGQKGTFCPTEKALNKYPQFFFYDEETDIWGLNNMMIPEFDEIILPVIVQHAIVVRKQFKEAAKRRAQARRLEKKVADKILSLF